MSSLWTKAGDAWKAALGGAAWGTEKAIASSLMAGFGSLQGKPLATKIAGKLGMAGLIVGAGVVGGKMIEKMGERRRAYVGDREYAAQYGGAFDTASGLVGGGGMLDAAAYLLLSRWKEKPIGPKYNRRQMYKQARRELVQARKDVRAARLGSLGMTTEARKAIRKEPKSRLIDALRRTKEHYEYSDSYKLKRLGTAAISAAGIAGLSVGTGLSIPASFGVLAAAAPAAWLLQRTTLKGIGSALSLSAPLVAGSAAGMMMPMHATAEGDIRSVEDRSSVVEKMNFSTAGLVQALHTNRKAF